MPRFYIWGPTVLQSHWLSSHAGAISPKLLNFYLLLMCSHIELMKLSRTNRYGLKFGYSETNRNMTRNDAFGTRTWHFSIETRHLLARPRFQIFNMRTAHWLMKFLELTCRSSSDPDSNVRLNVSLQHEPTGRLARKTVWLDNMTRNDAFDTRIWHLSIETRHLLATPRFPFFHMITIH